MAFFIRKMCLLLLRMGKVVESAKEEIITIIIYFFRLFQVMQEIGKPCFSKIDRVLSCPFYALKKILIHLILI